MIEEVHTFAANSAEATAMLEFTCTEVIELSFSLSSTRREHVGNCTWAERETDKLTADS